MTTLITAEDITKAIVIMSDIVPFFPNGRLGVRLVQASLESLVSTTEQLDWLVMTVCNTMKHFSLPELRGIFCSRFPPKDGIYAAAETPGYTAEDQMASVEAAYHERENEEYQRKLAEWKREAKLLGTTPAPFELPAGAVKQIAPPEKDEPKPPHLRLREIEMLRRSLIESEQEFAAELAEAQKRSDEEKARLLEELERALQSEKPTP